MSTGSRSAPHVLRPSLLLAATGLAVVLVACGDGNQTADTEGPHEVAVDAVTGTVQDPELSLVMDAAIDAEGNVWVLSVYPPHVRVYSSDGAPMTAFGDSGAGPGEFGNPRTLLPPPVGEEGMRVADTRRAVVRHFTPDGALQGERAVGAQMPLPHEIRFGFFGDLGRVWAVPGGVVQDAPPAFGGAGAPVDFWRAELRFIPDEGDPRSIGVLHELAGLPAPPPSGPGQLPRILGAGPLLDTCPDGSIVLHTGADARLVRISVEGDVVSDVGIDLPLAPNSVETMGSWLASVSETLDPGSGDSREAMRERARMMAELAEPVMEPQVPPTLLRCDVEGRIWIQLFDVNDDPRGYGRTWAVLDGDGVVTAFVLFPHGFLPLRIGDRRAVGVVRDEMGLETVGWATLPELP